MPRRKAPPGSGTAGPSDPVPSPLTSNFTIRFNKTDKDDDCVDITQDIELDHPLKATNTPAASATPRGEFITAPPRHKHLHRTEVPPTEKMATVTIGGGGRDGKASPDSSRGGGNSARSSAPSSPILGSPKHEVSTPFAEKVASLRDNLKERFASHRKNSTSSEDAGERLLTNTPAESGAGTPSGGVAATGAAGSSGPGLIGKLVKKIEERRGSHGKEAAAVQRSSSPITAASHSHRPERLSGLTGFYTDLVHGSSAKNGTFDVVSRSPETREPYQPTSTPTLVRDFPDDLSVKSAPIVTDAAPLMYYESFEMVPGKLRKVMSDSSVYVAPALDRAERVNEPPAGNCPAVRISREKDEPDPLSSPWASTSPLLLVGALLIAILVVPMPSFMSGLLFGIIFTAAASIRIWFTVLFPRKPRDHAPSSRYRGPSALVSGDTSKRYAALDPHDPPATWMNQMIGDFDIGTFSVGQTQNVYVSLDGTNLRIRKTKNRVLPRRAMYDEELKSTTFSFVESKVFNIMGAEVSLIPVDIPRKRRWLWRFPIGIKLVDPTSIQLCLEEIRETAAKQAEKDAKEAKKSGAVANEEKTATTPLEKAHLTDTAMLYLLPRSDREKEDWFWRLKAVTGSHAFPIQRPNLSANLSTLNILVHRICYDVLVDPIWEEVIKKKIQKKLTNIKLPYYIEELQITEMDLGKNIPILSNVSEKPGVDDRGIWVEMDFEYHGTVQMTLQTKLNLMKLKKGEEDQESKHVGHENDVEMDTRSTASGDSLGCTSSLPSHTRSGCGGGPGSTADSADRQSNLYESDEVDEFDEVAAAAPEGGKQKLMRYVEKITESKAFQKLTDVKIVRRAMENVSETDLALTVVVERLAGRLAINVPHPPSDKIWWGFTEKPDLHLKAFPKFGEREVTFSQVTDWLEKKLTSEFHRLITVPNMDDISVAVMNSALDDPEFRLAKLSDLILK